MSVTRGGRAKQFHWFVRNDLLVIQNEAGLRHTYTLEEIMEILARVEADFGRQWIPLANNVEKMYHETEGPGLGMMIYGLRPGDTLHAQGSSYLGVVLEEAGIFEWNRRSRGIAWRIVVHPADLACLRACLTEASQ